MSMTTRQGKQRATVQDWSSILPVSSEAGVEVVVDLS